MTNQERYDAEVAAAQALHARYQDGRQMMVTIEQDMIRADARMKLLEDLIKADAVKVDPLGDVELTGAANG